MGKGQKPKTQDEIIEKTAEYAARKLDQKIDQRKRRANGSASAELACSASNEEITSMVRDAFVLYSRPHAVTDDEVCESINWYFHDYIPNHGAFPTLEGLSLACGVNRSTFEAWARGEYLSSNIRSAVAQKAIAILAELDAQLVQKGKIPQVVYIFRSKNFYGMQDAVKHEYVKREETVQSAEELDKRYADAIVVDYVPADAEIAESDQGDGSPD